MWVAVGIDTKQVYMTSNTKSSLFLRLQKKYKTGNLKCGVYPETLMLQKRA